MIEIEPYKCASEAHATGLSGHYNPIKQVLIYSSVQKSLGAFSLVMTRADTKTSKSSPVTDTVYYVSADNSVNQKQAPWSIAQLLDFEFFTIGRHYR